MLKRITQANLTNVRASVQRVFNEAGNLVESANNQLLMDHDFTRRNVVLHNENLANAYWGLINAARETGVIAPDGSATAAIIRENTANGEHRIQTDQISWPSGVRQRYSVFLRYEGRRYIRLSIGQVTDNPTGTSRRITVDVLNGAIVTDTVYAATATVAAVGGGWYRFGFTMDAPSSTVNNRVTVELMNDSQAVSYTGDGASGVAIWRPQVQRGEVQTPAIRTTTATRCEPIGIRVEGARTNSIRNPRAEGGSGGTPGTVPTHWSAPATPSGFTRELAYGTEFGMPYIDVRLHGTPGVTGQWTPTFETAAGVVAATGQTWALSSFMRVAAGSKTNVSVIQLFYLEYTAAGGFLLAAGSPNLKDDLTSSLSRQSFVRATTHASVERLIPAFSIGYTNGQPIDITLRIYCPQLELGAFPSSPILPPVGAPAASTRAADAPTFDISALRVYNPLGTTVVAKGVNSVPAGVSVAARMWALYLSESVFMQSARDTGANALISSQPGTGVVSSQIASGMTGGQQVGIAVGMKDGVFRGSFNGASPAGFLPALLPRGLTALQVGHRNNALHWFGTISRIEINGTKFATDAELQQLSTLNEWVDA